MLLVSLALPYTWQRHVFSSETQTALSTPHLQTPSASPTRETGDASMPACPPEALWLAGTCVEAIATHDDVLLETTSNWHIEKDGRLVTYEHVPRRPDRPASYDRYIYPVPPWHGHTVGSGYDLQVPDPLQRRGSELAAVGHGGVDLAHDRGQPVQVVDLRQQVGEADVVFHGTLFGTTVMLRHVVRAGNTTQTYLALHGHLESVAPGIEVGQHVPAGTIIGFVGDSGAPGLVHLHYEVRLVRPHVDPFKVTPPTRLIGQEWSVPCDPRNVLPLTPS